jgi:hypothetical protein
VRSVVAVSKAFPPVFIKVNREERFFGSERWSEVHQERAPRGDGRRNVLNNPGAGLCACACIAPAGARQRPGAPSVLTRVLLAVASPLRSA